MSKTVKVSVACSVAATILFVYFLDPILRFIAKYFLIFARRLFASYVDSIYREIAVGTTDADSFGLMFLLIFFACFVVLKLYPLFFDELIKKDSKAVRPEERTNARFRLVLVAWVVTGAMWLITINTIKSSTITSFNQQMLVLSPYLDTTQEKKLVSQFHSMTSYADYVSIAKELQAIAAANNRTLPRNSLYSF